MKINFYHEDDILLEGSITKKLIYSHNNWIINGIDDLTSDRLIIGDFVKPLHYVRRHILYKDIEYIENINNESYRVNWFLKEPYPINEKRNSGFIINGNQSTLGLIYSIKIDPDDINSFKIKREIIVNAIWNTLEPIYGNRLSRKREENPIRRCIRDDLLIDGKKIAGFGIMIGKTRADFCCGLQNKFTQREEDEIKLLIKSEPQWNDNIKVSDIITGMNVDVNELISNLQKEVDKVYGA